MRIIIAPKQDISICNIYFYWQCSVKWDFEQWDINYRIVITFSWYMDCTQDSPCFTIMTISSIIVIIISFRNRYLKNLIKFKLYKANSTYCAISMWKSLIPLSSSYRLFLRSWRISKAICKIAIIPFWTTFEIFIQIFHTLFYLWTKNWSSPFVILFNCISFSSKLSFFSL